MPKVVLKATAIVLLLIMGGPLTSYGQQDNVGKFRFASLEIDDTTERATLPFSTTTDSKDSCYYTICYTINDSIKEKLEPIIQRKNTLWRIPLVQGKNAIKVCWKYKEKNSGIFDTVINYQYCGYWILSVGTGDKQLDTLSNLRYSTEDAQAFADTIEKKTGQKPEKSIVLNDFRATKDGIKASFDSICNDMDNKDWIQEKSLVIYLSGHGKKIEGESFKFQIKNDKGYDDDWMTDDEFRKLIGEKLKDKNVVVWFFVDACESIDFMGKDSNYHIDHVKIIMYSSQIKQGDSLYICDPINVKECENISSIIVNDKSIVNESCKHLKGKAIDGLFEHIFALSFSEPTDIDTLSYQLFCRYGRHIEREIKINLSRDDKVWFPGRIKRIQKEEPDKPPLGYIDLAIGWNLSHQWNSQIGYSWKKYSVFADVSFNFNWTDSITHALGENNTLNIIPSKSIYAIGVGFRWYRSINRVDLGFSTSVQTGSVYGEEEISEVAIIKHHQQFLCLTPTVSLRWFTSQKHCCRCYANVGYVFYLPCSINEDMINRDVKKNPPFVANVGISIPISFNKHNN